LAACEPLELVGWGKGGQGTAIQARRVGRRDQIGCLGQLAHPARPMVNSLFHEQNSLLSTEQGIHDNLKESQRKLTQIGGKMAKNREFSENSLF
jgi:hypothetical protein